MGSWHSTAELRPLSGRQGIFLYWIILLLSMNKRFRWWVILGLASQWTTEIEILRSTQNDTRETCHPESFDCHSEQSEESQDKLREGFGRELSRTDLWQNDPLPKEGDA